MTRSRKVLLALAAMAALGVGTGSASFNISFGAAERSGTGALAVAEAPGRETADRFMAVLAKGDLRGAFVMYAGASEAQGMYERFANSISPFARSGIQSASWLGFKASAVSAGYSTTGGAYAGQSDVVHTGVVKTAHAGIVDVTLRMVKVKGEWKILNFNFKTRPGTVRAPESKA